MGYMGPMNFKRNFSPNSMLTHIFTKLSQNVSLINTQNLIYLYARCNSKLWKALWFYCVFWVFSYMIDDHSCLKFCIFTKLSQIMCLINLYIFKCQHAKMWRQVMEGSPIELFLFWYFSYNYYMLKRYKFIKLS